MDNDPSLPPQRHAPPHIRLNSGSGDLLNIDQQQQYDSQSRPQTARQPSSRSLTSAGAAQTRPGTAGSLRQPGVYDNQGPQESAELLLPPRRNKTRRFRDEDSPTASGFNSRRTSWSSESAGSRDSRYGGPFASPFDDSRAPSRAGSDEDGVNTQTVSEKYNILPSAGLLLFPEDVEKDDYLHNPDPNEKEKLDCSDLFSKRGLVNVGGLALITIGVLILFIGYPILTFVQKAIKPAGSDLCKLDPNCLKENVATLKNVRRGVIDPDTPKSAMTRKDANGNTQQLVFSDEFNEDGRTFYPGDDPYWTAMDFWYGATQDLEWYDPDAATTKDGLLLLKFDAFQSHNLNYRSGMLQSWNQLCFKGGYMEASISLPGRGDTIGFWPGWWAMGNLGRPGYLSTTDGMWPYSYHDECDVGVTWNQSDPDGLSSLPGMRLPGCSCEGEDHPSPGIARSAPEIDALEASVGHLDANNMVGSVSQSFQVAPFDTFWRPNTDAIEVYDPTISAMNSYQGGVYQQALSTVTLLNNKWYDGNQYQKYGFEYTPGEDGYILWNVGDVDTWKTLGAATGPNGNIGQRVIPEEPLALILNFGMSTGFAELNLTGLAPLMPATMRIDYVRIYQGDGDELTCDPAGYPTTQYIANHGEAYNNPNLTHWDKAGFSWPKNTFVDECSTSTNSGKNKERKMAHKAKKAKKAKRSWNPFR